MLTNNTQRKMMSVDAASIHRDFEGTSLQHTFLIRGDMYREDFSRSPHDKWHELFILSPFFYLQSNLIGEV